jgi:hypothetical protein
MDIKTEILSAYTRLSADQLITLIHLTSGIKGCSFISIRNYNSDVSTHTELANHIVNIGVNYSNMVEKDYISINNIDINNVDIKNYNYDRINMGNLTLLEYMSEVQNCLSIALEELRQPKKERANNDITINKVLKFNTNTQRLSIFGQSIEKTVTIQGEYSKVKSAPKTVAKEIIKQYMNSRTITLRRFTLDNFISSIRLVGETIEIN